MKYFFEGMGCVTSISQSYFGGVQDHDADTGSFRGILPVWYRGSSTDFVRSTALAGMSRQVLLALYILVLLPLPFPFGRICFAVLVMRKGGKSSRSGPWHLGCTLEVFHVHSYQDQFIQPNWAEYLIVYLA